MIHPENMLSVDRTDWTSLPRSLHILTGTLAAMAIAVLGWSGWQFMDHLPAGGWIILAVFGIATFPFFIYFRRIETMVSIGDAYFMAIAILHGPATCVVATATYALVFLLSIKSFKPFLFVFNFSVLVCDAFAYSMIFQLFKARRVASLWCLRCTGGNDGSCLFPFYVRCHCRRGFMAAREKVFISLAQGTPSASAKFLYRCERRGLHCRTVPSWQIRAAGDCACDRIFMVLDEPVSGKA